MDEEKVRQMLDHRSSELDDRIRVALDLTEDFVLNHARGVDDVFMNRLKKYFSEEQIVELTIAIGIWDSVHKFNNVFGTTLINRAELEFTFFADNRLAEVVIRSRIVLTANTNDRVASAAATEVR